MAKQRHGQKHHVPTGIDRRRQHYRQRRGQHRADIGHEAKQPSHDAEQQRRRQAGSRTARPRSRIRTRCSSQAGTGSSATAAGLPRPAPPVVRCRSFEPNSRIMRSRRSSRCSRMKTVTSSTIRIVSSGLRIGESTRVAISSGREGRGAHLDRNWGGSCGARSMGPARRPRRASMRPPPGGRCCPTTREIRPTVKVRTVSTFSDIVV